ncbi:MAG: hypothetical protein ISR55_06755 [Bacteroidetes bacterium]|nr:hypothetical protein [Bacteroidota bacterium]MBL6963504.1 hypothetical protein [Bacteroidota bacterium]
MRKITFLLAVILSITFSLQSHADGGSKKTKRNNPIQSVKVIVEDLTVNFNLKLLKKTYYRMVLFTENGEYLKVLDEGMHKAKLYSYRLEKEKLVPGKYICLIETEKSIMTQFFEIEDKLVSEKFQIRHDKLNHVISIQAHKKVCVVHVFKEDGTFLKIFQVKGQKDCSKIRINSSDWEHGEYFIHILSGNKLYSETVKI